MVSKMNVTMMALSAGRECDDDCIKCENNTFILSEDDITAQRQKHNQKQDQNQKDDDNVTAGGEREDDFIVCAKGGCMLSVGDFMIQKKRNKKQE